MNTLQNPMRSIWVKGIIPFTVSAALLIALGFFVDWSQFYLFFSRNSLPYVMFAFLFYSSCQGLRGLRLTVLLRRISSSSFRYSDGIHIAFIGSFANHVLPVRTGELIFLLVPKYAYKINLNHSTLALLVSRVYDLLALAVIACIALVVLRVRLTLTWYILLFLSGAAIFLIAYRLDILIQAWKRVLVILFSTSRLQNWRFGKRVICFLDQMRQGLNELRQPGILITIFSLSLMTWASLIASFYYLLTSFAPSISYWEVIVGSLGVQFSQLLPINAFGNFGTYEAGWTAGFVAIGMSVSDAVSSGFASHLMIVGMAGVLALVSLFAIGGHIWAGYKTRKE